MLFCAVWQDRDANSRVKMGQAGVLSFSITVLAPNGARQLFLHPGGIFDFASRGLLNI